MFERGSSPAGLVVRRCHGVRHFSITWHSGLRRHTVSLGSERDGWTEQRARDLLVPTRRPLPPRRRREIELSPTAAAEIADAMRGLRRRADG
jgi:hypothetical protein